MTGEIESIGEVLTGAAYARAVEPGAGEEHRASDHGGACLNCGTALAGPYCHECGQPAHIHRSLVALWHDLAHGVLHFEGKLWHTLPELALRPGQLTRRYIVGERARFFSPLALFLFAVFLMFAVFSYTGGAFKPHINGEAQAEMAKEVQDMDREIAGYREKLADPGLSAADRARYTQKLDDSQQARAVVATVGGQSGISDTDVATGLPALDTFIRKVAHKVDENPSLLLYKMKSDGYKFAWALIFLSVPMVWLLFAWRREYKVYDHAIFTTYSLSFMLLLFVTLSLLSLAGVSTGVLVLAGMLIPPFHMYRQLRGAYAIGRFGALVRLAFLLSFALIALLTFFLLLLGMGALD